MGDQSGNPKLEWMYKTGQDLLNREEYLTGRKVDKQFEDLTTGENCVEHEVLPASISRRKNAHEDREQVDIIRKQMEDPLMAIKQKEMEARRKILENPVKLKELHRLLKQEKTDKESSKKSKKKSKRSRSSSSSSSSDSEDLDKLLLEKYNKIKDSKNDSDDDTNFIEKKFITLTKELDKMASKKKKRSTSEESGDYRKKKDSRRSPARHDERRRRDSPERKKRESPERGRFTGRRESPRRGRKDLPEKVRRDSPDRKRRQSPDRRVDDRRSDDRRGSDRRDDKRNDDRKPRDVRQKSRTPEKRRHRSRSHERKRESPRRKRSRTPRKDLRDKKPEETKYRNPSPPKQKLIGPSRRRSSSSSVDSTPAQHKQHFDDSDDERRLNKPKAFGLVTAAGERIALDRKDEVKYYTKEELKPVREAPKKQETSRKKPLTEDEMNAIRAEMMQNADWREKDREKTVKKHRELEEKEILSHVKDFDKSFLDRHLKKAQEQTKSLEKRIKSNLNNIQRSGRTMDSNFAKRL